MNFLRNSKENKVFRLFLEKKIEKNFMIKTARYNPKIVLIEKN